jgi:hypothetical protein
VVALPKAAERGTTVSNPQEPNQPHSYHPGPHQPEPNYTGQNPPPVPPAPGYPPQAGPAPQWQQQGQNAYAQGQNPYAQGQFNQPPPRKNRKVLWIVLSIVAGVIVLAVVGVLVLVNLVGNATSKARSLADEFTSLVVSGQTEQAYENYLSQPLKDELDKDSFMDGIASLELDSSCKPNYNSVNVNNNNGNNKADLSGTLQCDGKTINLQYVFEGTNDLKMSSIRLRP